MQNKNVESLRVCLVDDDHNIVEIYGQKLRQQGFEVLSASDGKSGFELIKNENPDLILLDIEMPGMGGIELGREIIKDPKLARIPLIILSNRDDEKTVKAASELQTKFYLVKVMFTPEKVVSMVREALHQAGKRLPEVGDDGLAENPVVKSASPFLTESDRE